MVKQENKNYILEFSSFDKTLMARYVLSDRDGNLAFIRAATIMLGACGRDEMWRNGIWRMVKPNGSAFTMRPATAGTRAILEEERTAASQAQQGDRSSTQGG